MLLVACWILKVTFIIIIIKSAELTDLEFTAEDLMRIEIICVIFTTISIVASAVAAIWNKVQNQASFLLCTSFSINCFNSLLFFAFYITQKHPSVDSSWMKRMPIQSHYQLIVVNFGPVILSFIDQFHTILFESKFYKWFYRVFFTVYFMALQCTKFKPVDYVTFYTDYLGMLGSALLFFAFYFATRVLCRIVIIVNKKMHS